ncbi:glycosyltransferase family 4 protein [Megalodesulfovibrio paquesii]
MGRIAANAGLLRALLVAKAFEGFHFFLPDEKQIRILTEFLQQEGLGDGITAGRIRLFTRQELPRQLATQPYHCAHLSDCLTSMPALARLRALHAAQAFPVTGATHTLSYSRFAPLFLAHLWPGASGREAIVATSRAALAMLAETFAWLRQGYGLQEVSHPGPRLAQIPLGVPPDLFPEPAPDRKAEARARLGLPQDRWTMLCFGRLSPAHKYDVTPLLRALQRCLAPGPDLPAVPAERLTLVLAGWTDTKDPGPADTWAALARNLGLHVTLLKRPQPAQKQDCFLAADCFISPSDSVQETFGITILEAGLAGLPVVASDFDGYRDLVVHGETGLLIPTIGAPESPGLEALGQLLMDEVLHLHLAQQTVVDVPALAEALRQLYHAPDRAAAMGQAGRRRVLEQYGWPAVVAQHCALWEDMWNAPEPVTRAAGVDKSARHVPHPLHFPYARLFAAHPSDTLSPQTRLRRTRLGEAIYRGQDHPQRYLLIEPMLPAEAVQRLIVLTRSPRPVGELLRRLVDEGGHDEETARFCLHWALKQDILERVVETRDGSAPQDLTQA